MTKFIELTDYNDEPLMVNVANIIWVTPYEAEEGTMIYVAAHNARGQVSGICLN